ncbi:MAG: 1-acyl-sn-glycerol-3-phosphate acyltransferase [Myxococcales bacterium]|nr:1-acyl-sn-glycerol-3-phosphate acyltransferase [Myxococcales bacterium]
MRHLLDRWKRIAGTGASFALFGFGSLVIGLVVHPILRMAMRREDRERAVQRAIHITFRWFQAFMESAGVIEVDAASAASLAGAPGRLLIANHPTLLDYVLVVAQLPQADCVVKRSHWSNPFTAGVVRGAGYVPNDAGETTVAECARRLAAGRTLLLFPEGTRSPAGGLGVFERGAAHVALLAGCPTYPVTIRCEPRGLMRGQPWYDVPASRMRFSFAVGAPIASETAEASRGRAARKLTARYRAHFEKELGRSA